MFGGTDTSIVTLHQHLTSCSKLIEVSDYSGLEQSIPQLVNFLNSISDYLSTEEPETEEPERIAIKILIHIQQYFASSTLKQDVIDTLAFELPKAVARFARVSSRCFELVEDLVDLFIDRCNPRDMLSILCEAIGSPSEPFMVPSYFIPLLSGLMKVLVLIQRRRYEQVKTAVPVILNVLKTMCSESDDEDTYFEKLFQKATSIAGTIRGIWMNLEGEDKKKLHALLSLYIMQIMAFVSFGMKSDLSKCLRLVVELSDLLQPCELSYIGLITGSEVDILKLAVGDSEDGMDCFSQVKLGASLGVIWGYKYSEVATAFRADLSAVMMELQGNRTRRWEAIGMLKYIFACPYLPWELKQHGISFLLCIMDGIVSDSSNDHVDYSIHMLPLYSTLKAIEMVIISDSVLRKNAFSSLKKVLADMPASLRSDILKALIKNCDSSSMIGILLDCFKEEMLVGITERNSLADGVLNSEVSQYTSFWDPSVLELMEVVLKPPKGGPPSLPEFSDAVLAALNLYRYILITESSGNSNSTGILSKDNLLKAYNDWFLPLRTLVTETAAECHNDYEEIATAIACTLNPVELVMYRCIELVEEKLKHT